MNGGSIVHAILAASILLQFVAAIAAIRLIFVTRRRAGWLAIAAAIPLMAISRSITLVRSLAGEGAVQPNLVEEFFSLVISALMVAGIFWIGPVFASISKTNEALKRSARAWRTLSEGHEAIMRARNESELMQEFCRIIVEAGGYRLAWVGFAEQDEDKNVRPVAYYGFEEGYLENLRITWSDTERGRGPTGTAIRTGEPAVARHILTEPKFAPWRDDALKRGYASSTALPLASNGDIFGALNIYAEEPDAFDEEETNLLTRLAGDLAFALTALRTRIERDRVEEQYHALVRSAPDAIVVTDGDGKIVFVNDQGYEMFGYKPGELVGRPVEVLLPERFHEVHVEHRHEYDAAPRTRRMGAGIELYARRKDGTEFPVDVSLSHFHFDTGIVVTSIVRDITDQVQDKRRIKRHLNQLEALRKIDLAITASLDPRVTFDVLLSQVTEQLGIDAADILVFNQSTQTLDFAAGRGFRTQALKHTHLRIGEGNAGKAALDRQIVIIPNLQEEENSLGRAPLITEEGFIAYYAVPLIAKGTIQGVMEIFNRRPISPNSEWLGFLEALASQAAIAIDNAMLFNDVNRSHAELLQAYDSTIEGWARALEIRDMETKGHSQRVTEMTLRLARRFGIDGPELMHVRRGALLHDIGKMGIPDAILNKPGALSDEEWEIMRKHPVYAYEMLSPIQYLRPALEIPYCHHEKWDGSGYPQGLKGEDIPLPARIFAVVDVWDALRSDRPYRAAWPDEKALAYIQEQSGKHFDPRVVELFFDSVISRTPPA